MAAAVVLDIPMGGGGGSASAPSVALGLRRLCLRHRPAHPDHGGADPHRQAARHRPTRPIAGPVLRKTGAPTDEMGSMIARRPRRESTIAGARYFQASGQNSTPVRASCCFVTPPMVTLRGVRSRRWGRSIARRTSRCSWTPGSSRRGRDALPWLLGQCLQVHRGLHYRPRSGPSHRNTPAASCRA